jgi:hypothetical protein
LLESLELPQDIALLIQSSLEASHSKATHWLKVTADLGSAGGKQNIIHKIFLPLGLFFGSLSRHDSMILMTR